MRGAGGGCVRRTGSCTSWTCSCAPRASRPTPGRPRPRRLRPPRSRRSPNFLVRNPRIGGFSPRDPRGMGVGDRWLTTRRWGRRREAPGSSRRPRGRRHRGQRGPGVKSLGDGVMATFEASADAVAAGVAVQQAIHRHNRRGGDERLAVRVGISVGDVTFEGGDCFGLPVVEAQCPEAAAAPGTVVCADVVALLVRGRGGHEFRSLGALELKNLAQSVPASEVVWRPAAEEATTPEALPSVLATAVRMPFAGRTEPLAAPQEAWEGVAPAGSRWCCWRVSPASARPAWRPSSPPPRSSRERRCWPAAATRTSTSPSSRSRPRCARSCRACPATTSPTAWGRVRRSSRGCGPSWRIGCRAWASPSGPTPRASGTPSSRRSPTGSAPPPVAGRRSSCSTTSTGPTPGRCWCCAGSSSGRRRGCWWSGPIATPTWRGVTPCRRCWPTCGACRR